MSTEDDLKWLRGRLEAATPGPWTAHVEDPGCDEARVGWNPEVLTIDGGGDGDMMSAADAQAFAALGTLWPELLAVAEAVDDDDAAWPAIEALTAAIRRHREVSE